MGVSIALGDQTLDRCREFDRDGSGTITVDELIVAVDRALIDCPPPSELPAPVAADNFDALVSNNLQQRAAASLNEPTAQLESVNRFHRPLPGERDFTDTERMTAMNTVSARHGGIVKLIDATITYNAHGKTFDNRGAWIDSDQVEQILESAYAAVDGPAAIGDIVVYRQGGLVTYSGKVMLVDAGGVVTEVQGKWGAAGEYSHALNDVPAPYGDPMLFRKATPAISCASIQLTDTQIGTAVTVALNGVEDPWGEDLALAIERSAVDLGCGLGTHQRAEEQSGAQALETCEQCAGTFCPSVQYCGRGNSLCNPFQPHPLVTQCLNHACFVHDTCYGRNCVGERCDWSPQSHEICDDALTKSCEVFGECGVIGTLSPLDRITCFILTTLDLREVARSPVCNSTPCSEPTGASCIPAPAPTLGICKAPTVTSQTTLTRTPTLTRTKSPTATDTATRSFTPTASPTVTLLPTGTLLPSHTVTLNPTVTPTLTQTLTATPAVDQLSFSPRVRAIVAGGGQGMLSLVLSRAVEVDTNVTLSVSAPSVADTLPSVTIPGAATSTLVTVQGGMTGVAIITATVGSKTAQASIFVDGSFSGSATVVASVVSVYVPEVPPTPNPIVAPPVSVFVQEGAFSATVVAPPVSVSVP
jgi:hypothetical protein